MTPEQEQELESIKSGWAKILDDEFFFANHRVTFDAYRAIAAKLGITLMEMLLFERVKEDQARARTSKKWEDETRELLALNKKLVERELKNNESGDWQEDQ